MLKVRGLPPRRLHREEVSPVKYSARCLLFLLLSSSATLAQTTATSGFRTVLVDADRVIGEIHSFQGLNGMPAPVMAGLPSLVKQYRGLRIGMVRTHDVMGPTDVDAKFKYDDKY
jgi:hypothetical protein